MRRAALGAALLLAGCASAPIELDFAPAKGLLGGQRLELRRLRIDPELYARGCVAIDVDGGEVRITFQQDGTSDWMVGRALPVMLPQMVTAALAVVSAPADIVKGLLGLPTPAPQPPAEVNGCHGIRKGG